MTCQYCSNRAMRSVHNPYNDAIEDVCEIHYAYLKPSLANVNPVDVGRCMRCGAKALNRRGDAERLLDHHVNYPLDLTVPVCDPCHREIHDGEAEGQWLEQTERDTEPFAPVGGGDVEGAAVHSDYRDERRPPKDIRCSSCETAVILAPREMGHPSPFICPNAECYTVCVDTQGDGVVSP